MYLSRISRFIFLFLALIVAGCSSKIARSTPAIPETTISGKLFQNVPGGIKYLNLNSISIGEDVNENLIFRELVLLDKNGNFAVTLHDSVPTQYIFKEGKTMLNGISGEYLSPGQYFIELNSRFATVHHSHKTAEYFKIAGNDTIPVMQSQPAKMDSIYNTFYQEIQGVNYGTAPFVAAEKKLEKELEAYKSEVDPLKNYHDFLLWRKYYLNYCKYDSTNNIKTNGVTLEEFDKILDDYFIPYPFDIADQSDFRTDVDAFLVNRMALENEYFFEHKAEDFNRFRQWIATLKNKDYRDYFLIDRMRHYSEKQCRAAIDSLEKIPLSQNNKIILNGIKKTFANMQLFSRADGFPDLPLIDGNGHTTTLSQLKTPLKLVSIYDKNCLPCRADYKVIDTLKNRAHYVPAMIVISRNQDYKQTIKEHLEMGVNRDYIYFVTDNSFYEKCRFLGFPSYYYLNKDNILAGEANLETEENTDTFDEQMHYFNSVNFDNESKRNTFLKQQ